MSRTDDGGKVSKGVCGSFKKSQTDLSNKATYTVYKLLWDEATSFVLVTNETTGLSKRKKCYKDHLALTVI